MQKQDKIMVYFGFNNPLIHKRGVENVILFQSRALDEEIKKYYIFFGEKNESFLWSNFNCISIKKNFLRFLRLNMEIRKLANRGNIIIHSHNFLMSFFLLRKTNIFTVHDALYYLSVHLKHRLKSIFKFIEKRVYQKSYIIHFISDFSKKNSLYKGKHYDIIFNTTPLEEITINLKEEIWKTNKIKIFTVRSLEERAAIDILIELAMRNKKFDIKIAGKGPLLEKYKTIIQEKKLSNIELLGYISDEKIIQYYFECDIVTVLAKYGEGFGLPIIEGYLYDKAVFASNVCAIPEIIIDKEFLIENNAKMLENKIINYLKTESKYSFQNYYYGRFSYKTILLEYRKLYKKIGI